MESITGGNTPKYQELTEQLRLQIVSGEIAPGQKLPSENTLSAQYQVSRQTVRKALAILQNEGYIYAEHGRGTFCSEMMRHAHPSKNIAVVTTYLSDYIFPRVIQGIDDVLTGAGYSIVLKNTKNSRTREAECLQEILSKDIDEGFYGHAVHICFDYKPSSVDALVVFPVDSVVPSRWVVWD
jgi:GntR family transcriptional regulator of arabinose operon